jgi:hypothetical protein
MLDWLRRPPRRSLATLLAVCEPRPAEPGAISFGVREVAVLPTGQRVDLADERGFTWSAMRGPGPDPALDPVDLERDVHNVLLPDDDDAGTAIDVPRVAALLRRHRIAVPDDLASWEYAVELAPEVLESRRSI